MNHIMLRNRTLLKSLAIFFVLEIMASTVWPTISYALTAGPTAPEATSFEPVDTTDLVNLATGDLVYNIPLLEVPGPSGGYPLSLSYHAGIMPEEESSWVGLGFNLTPGSINRSISGYADDHNNVLNTDRFFWEGGERHTLEVGLTAGISGMVGASAGYSFSYDTYQGFGVGMYAGVTVGITNSVGVSGKIGIDAYGNPYGSVGLGVGLNNSQNSAISLGIGVGLSTNFKSVSAYASGGVSVGYDKPGERKDGMQAGGASLIGASISTGQGVNVSLSVGGVSGIHNSKVDKISTTSWGFTLPIPFINLGYNYQRYWIDETEKVNSFGALYNPKSTVSGGYDKKAYDSYSLLDPAVDIVDNPDPDKVLGGNFLNYDMYNVNAQGLGGYIRPYSFKNLIFQQNRKKSGSYHIKQFPYQDGYRSEQFEFRFIGDLSNKYINSGGSLASGAPPLIPLFGFSEKTGEAGNTTNGFSNGHLIGSRHVEWYTNNQILNIDNTKNPEQEGFMDCRASGFVRSGDGSLGDQVGGFKITNESGVTYHFALPVYITDEYQRSENIKKTDGKTFNELTKKEPYAYTWYLTGITGPDYIDRGPTGTPDGEFNEYDWGYWVEFEYGKWTEMYAWRNPSEGMMPDLDNDFKNFSEGLKELYYLDAIRTKTHTALFVKSIRHDSKSTTYSYRNKSIVFDDVKTTITSATKEGGFVPKNITNTCSDLLSESGSVQYTSRPTSTLKLESVYLFLNEELDSIPVAKSTGTQYYQNYPYPWSVSNNNPNRDYCDFSLIQFLHHLPQHVLDVHDIASVSNTLKNKAIRIIDFETNYDLTPETENSFDYSLVNISQPSTDSNNYPRFGRLTLSGLRFKGKSGSDLIPPMKFYYDLDNPLRGTGYFYKQSGSAPQEYLLSQANSGLQEGDLIKINSNDRTCYALVYEVSGSSNKIKIIGKKHPYTNQQANWNQTKNPPYNKDNHDIWGMFKSDYDESVSNEVLKRLVTASSSKNIDAWCLRKIVSNLGSEIKIEYESDEYQKPVVNFSSLLRIQSIEKIPNTSDYKITVLDEAPFLDEILPIGSEISCLLHIGHPYWSDVSSTNCPGANHPDNSLRYFDYETHEVNVIIQNIYLEDSKWVINAGSVLNPYFTSKGSDVYFKTIQEIWYQCGPANWSQYYCEGGSSVSCSFTYLKDYIQPDLIAGNISYSQNTIKLGGGVRVKSVAIRSSNSVLQTSYFYDYGTTSYEPLGLDQDFINYPETGSKAPFYSSSIIKGWSTKAYKKRLYKKFSELLANSREIPSPGVIYQNVTVREFVDGKVLPNSSKYQFETFNEDDIGIIASLPDSIKYTSNYPTYDNVTYRRVLRKNITIKEMTSKVGALRSITLLDSLGNKINETVNHYLSDDLAYENFEERAVAYESQLATHKSIGMIQETLMDGRFVKEKDGTYSLIGVTSRRHYYPNIQTGQTTINYKTGIKTESKNFAFDFYSGQVTSALSKDGYGNSYVTISNPAYRVSSYSAGMGFAASGGKNMLVQEASAFTYKVNDQYESNPVAQNTIGLASASVQTWSNQVSVLNEGTQPGIWRKHAGYSFIGDDAVSLQPDGLYPGTATFTAWNKGDATPSGWQKNGEITLYDVNSHALEAGDINDQFAATRMTHNQTKVTATVANARYNEFTYSGAEDEVLPDNSLGNHIKIGIGGSAGSVAHTGTKSVVTTNQGFVFEHNITAGKKYIVSVWSSGINGKLRWQDGAGSAQDVALQPKRQSGNWYLLTGSIQPSNPSVKVWCQSENSENMYFDDFRIHPTDAAMISYVYNKWGELSHVLDNKNLFTEYRYDGMGRLTQTYKETFVREGEGKTYGNKGIVKVSEIQYNYGSKNPYLLPLTITKSGSTGSIYYTGEPAVAQGKDFTFEIREQCPIPKFGSLLIDNQLINITTPGTQTLLDGTMVIVNGKIITLQGIISPHSIHVNFTDFTGTGYAICHVEQTTNQQGNTVYCRDGSFDYWYYNACGEEGYHYRVWSISQVPQELRGYLPPEGCPVESGSNCSGIIEQ